MIIFATQIAVRRMTIRDWIKEKEIGGSSHFSVEELQLAFPQMGYELIRNELYRLSSRKVVTSVYKGFYVIIPVQYASKGVIPPLYYVDQLMSYINKPYYISLLSAAEILGAAHQRPQRFYITTLRPSANVSKSKNPILEWIFRTNIPAQFLLQKNSQTGTIRYSNAELTAVDLVQHSHYVGGLTRVTTILSELIELTDFRDKIDALLEFFNVSTLQRLGYLLEVVLEDQEQADVIYEQLLKTNRRLNYIILDVHNSSEHTELNKRWRIKINTDIEIDEI